MSVTADQSLVKPKIRVKFGTAGIRGIYGQEVSVRETMAVCFAVHELLGEGKFGLGYDSRRTSFILSMAACSAMNWYGSDIYDYGLIPTPVLAFNIKNSKLHAGFSVTASHNPPEYAGVKVFGTDGIEFSLEAEHKLEELIQKSEGYIKSEQDKGSFGSTIGNDEAVYSYKQEMLRRANTTRKRLKILVDCANGTSGPVTPALLSELGHNVVTVNAHPSAGFPGRLPEPMAETLLETATLVRAIGADFGIAHDGDADRLVMIDEFGNVVPDYALSALVLKIVVEKVRRGVVIISQNSSTALEEVAINFGCKVQRSRLGKTFEELYKRKGVYASEPSKIVDPRWGYWEDGIYAGVLVSQYLSDQNLRLSQAIESVPKYFNYQQNIVISWTVNYNTVKAMVYEKFGNSVDRFEELDGVKVYLKDGSWSMVRTSGTEKKVRIYAESSSQVRAEQLLRDTVSIVEQSYKK